jgi:hypothetical protein
VPVGGVEKSHATKVGGSPVEIGEDRGACHPNVCSILSVVPFCRWPPPS